jgi:hypothetical protein
MSTPQNGPHGLPKGVVDQTVRETLRLIEEAVAAHPKCPVLLVKKAILIQTQDDLDGTPTLDDAERCLLEAHALDDKYLDALEELAHFYDAVNVDRAKARSFAEQYIGLVSPVLRDMTEIRDGAQSGTD